jgi:cohesin loading factor subunit SCC2
MPQILDAALSTNVNAQRLGIDIIGYSVKQGLAHPIEVSPVFLSTSEKVADSYAQSLAVLVSLETSVDPAVVARAYALHSMLQTKHANLLHTRFFHCARQSWQYQTKVSGSFRGELGLAPLYDISGPDRDCSRVSWRTAGGTPESVVQLVAGEAPVASRLS